MKTLFALALVGAVSSGAAAQTPAANPMPDGSRDMYVGLGLVSAPEHEGARAQRVSPLPLLQFQWSNGIFVSGLSAGIHMSAGPTLEYGPLLALHSRRSEYGVDPGADGMLYGFEQGVLPREPVDEKNAGASRLAGMEPVKARLQAGFFINHYLNPQWRVTNSVLYGAGRQADGLVWQLGLQHLARPISQHHAMVLTAGVTLVDENYNASYFGVTRADAELSAHPRYAPDAGVKDAYLLARWNWTLSPSWILSSGLRVTQLQGDARHSPLVERPTNVAVSTGLAYRF